MSGGNWLSLVVGAVIGGLLVGTKQASIVVMGAAFASVTGLLGTAKTMSDVNTAGSTISASNQAWDWADPLIWNLMLVAMGGLVGAGLGWLWLQLHRTESPPPTP
jgi:hypothetical protein